MDANQRMIYQFGDYVLDPGQQELKNRGSIVSLEPKTYRMLAYFVANAGRLIGKDELLKHVWPSVNVDETAVRRCIRNIRKALGENRFEQKIIETRHGLGYRFLPEVTVSESSVLVDPLRPLQVLTAPEEEASEPDSDAGSSLLDAAVALSQLHHFPTLKRRHVSELDALRPEVFLDVTFGVALALRNHPAHVQARALAEDFQRTNTHFVTTRPVLVEIGAKVSEALGAEAAAELLDAADDDENLEILTFSDKLYVQAKRYAERHGLFPAGAEVDFVSRFIMRQRDISEALPVVEQASKGTDRSRARRLVLPALGCGAAIGIESLLLSLAAGPEDHLASGIERGLRILIPAVLGGITVILFTFLSHGAWDRRDSGNQQPSLLLIWAGLIVIILVLPLLLAMPLLALSSLRR
jgi:DNA-binding winged helix-turn-helix (wHTH) protein/predicted nucleic acid-binding protein